MSKELTPLEHLQFIREYEIDDDHYILNYNYAIRHSLDIIETALKELNDIKSGKIRLSVKSGENYGVVPKYQYEQDLKKLKAFEIIKEKRVDCSILYQSENLEEYNSRIIISYSSTSKQLTQEEFDSIKGVL